MSRLIDADKLIEDITIVINEWIKDMVYGEYLEGCVSFSVVAREMVRKQPTAFDVEKVIGQYIWERDIVISQLEQLGIRFGEKLDAEVIKKVNRIIANDRIAKS